MGELIGICLATISVSVRRGLLLERVLASATEGLGRTAARKSHDSALLFLLMFDAEIPRRA